MEDYKKKNSDENSEPVSKYTEYSDNDDDNYEDMEEYIMEQNEENVNKLVDCIYDTQQEMLQYCDDLALPLCDYLTYDSINLFIDILNKY